MNLRFVSKIGDALELEAEDGARFTLLIDDQVRDALRKTAPASEKSVSPKDVQSAIRSGQSVADLAKDLGVPESSIEPFAAPILDELRYLISAALATTIPSGTKMRTFEELVSQSCSPESFRISKQESGWVLASGEFSWRFDPKAKVLEPISPQAKELTRGIVNDNELIRATSHPVTQQVIEATSDAASEPEVDSESASAGNQSASVHDLVQELRARRNPEDIKPASAKGRAALPSWDEIVLGTASLDTDPN